MRAMITFPVRAVNKGSAQRNWKCIVKARRKFIGTGLKTRFGEANINLTRPSGRVPETHQV
jgi:hypothetical protein